MKILLYSDLHLESRHFAPPHQAVQDANVIVLAGDIHEGTTGIKLVRRMFPGKQIVYVAGNHEFYGQRWEKNIDALRTAAQGLDIHFLENEAVVIDGTRFLGCTLWADLDLFGPEKTEAVEREIIQYMTDFSEIRVADPSTKLGRRFISPNDVRARHAASRAWLAAELHKGNPDQTVVVTHHAPSERSVSEEHMADLCSAMYATRMPLDLVTGAGLWIHGHMHESRDYLVEHAGRSTRVVCNPRGYPMWMAGGANQNEHFNAGLLL